MRSYLFRATSEIVSLSRSGRIIHARKLFDEMPERDSVAWNAMLTVYSRLGHYHQTLTLFDSLRLSDSKPDNFSYSAAINSCAGASDLRFGTKLHALVVASGYQSSLPVANSLVDMYGKCSNPNDARKVFDEMSYCNEVTWCSLLFAYANSCRFDMAFEVFGGMPEKVEIAWNIVIAAHARCGQVEACLYLFKDMCESLYQPDQWTLSALVNACAESMELLCGCMVHCFVIKSGWSTAMEVNNSMVSFYAKLECHGDAVKVFDSGGAFNQVSWNAIIDAHMKVGDTQKALLAFQQAPEKNIVSWTSMIVGYTRNGNGDLALNLFLDMKRNSSQLDDLVAGAVLHACASLAILVHGRMVHTCTIRLGLDKYLFVGNSLINMYAKCGDVEGSRLAFHAISEKDTVSWNSMLFAFGLNGRGNEAICMFREMVASGVRPDEVTFTGLLMTCSHLGLIDEGLALFQSMSLEFGFTQRMDHVACMVDMLGRGGYVAEARSLAKKYSTTSKDRTNSCEVLLGACYTHGDLRTGSSMGENLMNLEPKKESGYVLLSNMYCASGKWEEAEMVRKEMMDQGVKKVPGCSWIEIRNVVTAFASGNKSYSCMDDISSILYILELEMRHTWPINFDTE